MPKVVLTPEDRVAILSAPAETTHRELSRALGRPRLTIAQFRSRVRRAGGWYSAVTLVACAECGRPLLSSYHRKAHQGCKTAQERSVTSRAVLRPALRVAAGTRPTSARP